MGKALGDPAVLKGKSYSMSLAQTFYCFMSNACFQTDLWNFKRKSKVQLIVLEVLVAFLSEGKVRGAVAVNQF